MFKFKPQRAGSIERLRRGVAHLIQVNGPTARPTYKARKENTMQDLHHDFSDLFAQLGLPHSPQGIAQFLAAHRPLAGDIRLPDAPFWSTAQATFLRETLQLDSDWAEVADQLSEALRGPENPGA